MLDYQPIMLVGAARSGTKMLRDVIATSPQVDVVPYDINYIWRYGNSRIRSDEIPVHCLTPKIVKHIRCEITKYHQGAPNLIEKTVSNCLRLPYVNAVFPNARYIHLVRDGRDVIESVHRQWIAKPDWSYIWQKARRFPLRSAFGYGFRYAAGLLRKSISSSQQANVTWGPRYEGIDEDVARKDLWEVCAIQWLRSVEMALRGLSSIQAERQLLVRYEEFVTQPEPQMKRIAAFLDIEFDPYSRVLSESVISDANIGKGLRVLQNEQLELILPHLQKGLALLNYET